MGFHFSTKIFYFRRNLQFRNFLIRSPARIISSFSTFSAENPFYAHTFSHLFQECSKNKANEAGRQAHAQMIVSGFKPTVFATNCLIQMYIKCSRLECAAKVFDRMPQRDCVSWTTMMFGYSVNGKMGLAQSLFDLMPQRNEISWTSLISGYVQNGSCLKAVEVFVMMGRDAVAYDAATLSLVLKAVATLENYALGVQMHGAVVKLGLDFNVVTVNALMSMYEKCKMFNELLQIYIGTLRSGIEPDGFTYSTVLKACADREAKMLEREISPTNFVFATVLNTRSHEAKAGLGKQIHAQIIKQSMQSNAYIINTLVDMYSKCGNMQDSILMFRESSNRNTVIWNSIICAYARHGCGNEALQAFEEMLLEKVTPDHVTFTGVLSACAYVGLVDEALHYFHMMKAQFGLEAEIQHYSCMVDALGRCGRIMDALKLIQVMPLKANDAIWVSLLSNCKMHGNVKVAEIAARNVLQLDPLCSSAYVLLSQTYADAGMWDEASKTRKMMSSRVKNRPGHSMIVTSSI